MELFAENVGRKNKMKNMILNALDIYGNRGNHIFDEELKVIKNGNGIDTLIDMWQEGKKILINVLSCHKNWNPDTYAIEDYAKIPRDFDSEYYASLCNELYDSMVNTHRIEKFFDCLAACTPVPNKYDVLTFKYLHGDIYHKDEKPSRRLLKLCKKWGINEEEWFNQWYAKASDAIAVKEGYRYIYLSVNPADLLTISNPAKSSGTKMLVSCQSLDNYEHGYRSGNTGYCNDKYTAVLFTTSENTEEARYTRKTDRQLVFINETGFVQNRLYGTGGGIDRFGVKHKFFRAYLQKILAECLGIENEWEVEEGRTYIYSYLKESLYYGGYCDWVYNGSIPLISKVAGRKFRKIEVGGTSICLGCGEHTERGILCEDCFEPPCICEHCGSAFLSEENDGSMVWTPNGEVWVCNDCLEGRYTKCADCGTYYPNDSVHWVESRDGYVCDDCLCDYYTCDNCEEVFPEDDVYEVVVEGTDEHVGFFCRDCIEDMDGKEVNGIFYVKEGVY